MLVFLLTSRCYVGLNSDTLYRSLQSGSDCKSRLAAWEPQLRFPPTALHPYHLPFLILSLQENYQPFDPDPDLDLSIHLALDQWLLSVSPQPWNLTQIAPPQGY